MTAPPPAPPPAPSPAPRPASLLTPAVRALIGQTSEVVEMYGTIDEETVRRYVIGIPDQDARHWDAALAGPRPSGPTTPGVMVSYVGARRPPREPDETHRRMLEDPLRDSVSMTRSADIQQKVGGDGRPFLLITRETRYWNQDDETILVIRALGIER